MKKLQKTLIYLFFITMHMYCFPGFLPLLSVKSGERRWAGGPLNKEFLQITQKIFGPDLFFIETGTYRGDSSAIAAEIFEHVYTIELSCALYQKACQRFANTPNITLYCGDSASMLSQILEAVPQKTLLWLDGHWSKGDTARGLINTPIMQELRALTKSNIKNNILLIDDIRFFQKPFKEIEDIALQDYPDLSDVIDAIHLINPHYTCWVYGDVLMAYCDSQVCVAPIIKALTTSRLNSADEKELYNAEMIIAHACPEEKNIIRDLCHDFADDCGYGFNRYYHFWYALTLLNCNEDLAYHHMKTASDAGCQRARCYLKS